MAPSDESPKISFHVTVALCVLILGFYAYHYWKATTGWEEGELSFTGYKH